MKKFAAVILLVLFIVPMSLVSAQESAEDDAFEANGAFIQVIDSAEFVASEEIEDAYTLTIADSAANIQWILTGNTVAAGQYSARDFSDDWAFAIAMMEEEDFSVEAILTTDDAVITLMLSNPQFAEDSFSYTVTIVAIDIFAEENDDKAELPEAIEDAALFIPLYPEVAEALTNGRNERVDSTRDTDVQPTCNPANFPSC